ncbi:MAG: glycosyl transferase family 2 [candidate division NC10 bacterium]|nr:glycosyl transferase family 2 [candidate division NC10 bacterium]
MTMGGAVPEDAMPSLSVVIPVYNEERNLDALYARLRPVLNRTGRPYEVIFVDDGSVDRSLEVLRRLHDAHRAVQVIALNRNYGQHAAVFAGLDHARGDVIVTLDADLQNPPEEIPRLLAQVEAGHDVVGGWRQSRRDPSIRRLLSWCVNRLTSFTVGVRMRDYGCMLRAYRREVVDTLRGCREISSFVPALANSFARSPVEIPVGHDNRANGRSRYGPFRLIRLAMDLMTGFSLLPIQVVSLAGIGIALLGVGFGVFLLVRRLFVGPEVEGVFTLFAILFVFVGIQVLALGLIGEYVGRIYLEVRRRPRYVVQAVYDHADDTAAPLPACGSAPSVHE